MSSDPNKLDAVYLFFREHPPVFINNQLAVAYVLSVLVRQDSYGTELMEALKNEETIFRVSDTVLWNAFRFLRSEDIVEEYSTEKHEGRGRPRKMFKLREKYRPQAKELALLWDAYNQSLSEALKPFRGEVKNDIR